MEDRLIEYRINVYDAIARGDSEREVSLWQSDIKRLTDYMLWVYNEWSSPMEYKNGNLLDFNWNQDPLNVKSIEKKYDDTYEVTIGYKKIMLDSITDSKTLKSLARLLMNKEFQHWDYVCDMAGSYQREFEEVLNHRNTHD